MAMFKGEKARVVADTPDRLNRLVAGSKLEGSLKTESSLRIDGEVVGDLECAGKIVLGADGRVTGNIFAFEAEIEGVVTGNVKVESILTLRNSAKVGGDIITGRIVIEDGADFNGNCQMSNKTLKSAKKIASAIAEDNQPDVVY